MKKTAYLINVARGPLVDQQALFHALRTGQIQGAGLDVFEQEPIAPDDPILTLDNAILSPHALCWTDECFGLNGRSAITSLIDVARGIAPRNIVNRDALAHERLRYLKQREME
jgi:phosphoglycerate dehydrogenase-like enzyme